MRAMILRQPGEALQRTELPEPEPGPGQVLVEVLACGVCRTDLHVVDGELTQPKLPLVPGHEIVGRVVRTGSGAAHLEGRQIIVPWLGHTCGRCPYCLTDRENLCDAPGFTGYTLDGGYAELALADAEFCFPIEGPDPVALAPLACAGLIGYRSLVMAGEAERLGIYGFGAAAHILAQVARHQGRRVFAFTRAGDTRAQAFAGSLGVAWVGDAGVAPPEPLDAVIIFAPIGSLVPEALARVRKGGIVVCGGIHMSDIPTFPYRLLWEERQVRSVANLTRNDAQEFLTLATRAQVRTTTVAYPLEAANRALDDLRAGRLAGAAVLVP